MCACTNTKPIACLRDLKKAIRIDSQNNEKIVLNTLKEHNVVRTDIVPLLLSYRNQRTEVADRFILACGNVDSINAVDRWDADM